LVCSGVGNLGLDLKNGRVVVAESLGYHMEDYNQLVSRYVRFGAAACLPPDKRDIQPYILISTTPPEVAPDGTPQKPLPSTDEELLYRSLTKLKNNAAFIEVAHSVSIECLAGVSATPEICRRCLPTGRSLTVGKFAFNMALPDPCVVPPEDAKGAATAGAKSGRVLVKDGDIEREFDYVMGATPASIIIREWDAETQELSPPIAPTHPLWSAIMATIRA
jgi:hypothetical protein